MLVIYQDQKLNIQAKDFDDLTEQVERQLQHQIPAIYKMYMQDEGDEIIIVTDEDLKSAIQLCGTKKTPLVIQIAEVDMNESQYILKKQYSTEQSRIFQQSSYEIGQKLQDLRNEQFNNSLNQAFEESVFIQAPDKLTIASITDYYKNQLNKFRNNFTQQSVEHQAAYLQLYQQGYQQIVTRMCTKLNDQFQNDLNRASQLRPDIVDQSDAYLHSQKDQVEAIIQPKKQPIKKQSGELKKEKPKKKEGKEGKKQGKKISQAEKEQFTQMANQIVDTLNLNAGQLEKVYKYCKRHPESDIQGVIENYMDGNIKFD